MIGLKELAVLALVVLVLYGRTGVLKSRQFQTIWPWISPQRRAPGRPGTTHRAMAAARPQATEKAVPSPSRGRSRTFLLEGNRLFWFLTILAATAVAAWIITRVMIASGAGPGASR